MDNVIFKDEDAEVIRMVNINADRRRRAELRNAEPSDVGQKPTPCKIRLTRIGAAAVRMGAGLIFIGGMVQGLMDPWFALAAMLACIGWGLATYLHR